MSAAATLHPRTLTINWHRQTRSTTTAASLAGTTNTLILSILGDGKAIMRLQRLKCYGELLRTFREFDFCHDLNFDSFRCLINIRIFKLVMFYLWIFV